MSKHFSDEYDGHKEEFTDVEVEHAVSLYVNETGNSVSSFFNILPLEERVKYFYNARNVLSEIKRKINSNGNEITVSTSEIDMRLGEVCKWSEGTNFPHRYITFIHKYGDNIGNFKTFDQDVQLPEDQVIDLFYRYMLSKGRFNFVPNIDANNLLHNKGGSWLGTVREFMQCKFRNGDIVKWGSHEYLEGGSLTVWELEHLSSKIAASAINEYIDYTFGSKDKQIKFFTCIKLINNEVQETFGPFNEAQADYFIDNQIDKSDNITWKKSLLSV